MGCRTIYPELGHRVTSDDAHESLLLKENVHDNAWFDLLSQEQDLCLQRATVLRFVCQLCGRRRRSRSHIGLTSHLPKSRTLTSSFVYERGL